jgi:hypothetical protein
MSKDQQNQYKIIVYIEFNQEDLGTITIDRNDENQKNCLKKVYKTIASVLRPKPSKQMESTNQSMIAMTNLTNDVTQNEVNAAASVTQPVSETASVTQPTNAKSPRKITTDEKDVNILIYQNEHPIFNTLEPIENQNNSPSFDESPNETRFKIVINNGNLLLGMKCRLLKQILMWYNVTGSMPNTTLLYVANGLMTAFMIVLVIVCARMMKKAFGNRFNRTNFMAWFQSPQAATSVIEPTSAAVTTNPIGPELPPVDMPDTTNPKKIKKHLKSMPGHIREYWQYIKDEIHNQGRVPLAAIYSLGVMIGTLCVTGSILLLGKFLKKIRGYFAKPTVNASASAIDKKPAVTGATHLFSQNSLVTGGEEFLDQPWFDEDGTGGSDDDDDLNLEVDAGSAQEDEENNN